MLCQQRLRRVLYKDPNSHKDGEDEGIAIHVVPEVGREKQGLSRLFPVRRACTPLHQRSSYFPFQPARADKSYNSYKYILIIFHSQRIYIKTHILWLSLCANIIICEHACIIALRTDSRYNCYLYNRLIWVARFSSNWF